MVCEIIFKRGCNRGFIYSLNAKESDSLNDDGIECGVIDWEQRGVVCREEGSERLLIALVKELDAVRVEKLKLARVLNAREHYFEDDLCGESFDRHRFSERSSDRRAKSLLNELIKNISSAR